MKKKNRGNVRLKNDIYNNALRTGRHRVSFTTVIKRARKAEVSVVSHMTPPSGRRSEIDTTHMGKRACNYAQTATIAGTANATECMTNMNERHA